MTGLGFRGAAGATLVALLLGGHGLPAGAADALVIEKGVVTVNEIAGPGTVPEGAIMMWSGDPKVLPAGWVLCDGVKRGKHEVPNLAGRFILGRAPGSFPMRSEGGAGAGGAEAFSTTGTVLTVTGAKPTTPTNGTAVVTPVAGNLPPYYVLAYIMYVGPTNLN
ncbi:MAG: hypothetical protein HY985_13775 [Magnetospirillum sp.]|nr:hypothetical protein [Magnetospirillum sp.]